jgi:hypothetical protein
MLSPEEIRAPQAIGGNNEVLAPLSRSQVSGGTQSTNSAIGWTYLGSVDR